MGLSILAAAQHISSMSGSKNDTNLVQHEFRVTFRTMKNVTITVEDSV